MCVKFILSLLNNTIPQPKDVYEVLRPLQIICQIIGLAPYNMMIKSDGSKAYVRTSWSFVRYVILFILYTTVIVADIRVKANRFDGGIEKYLGNLQEYFIALIMFVVITFGYIFSNKVIEMFERVDDIDREFKDLANWNQYINVDVNLFLAWAIETNYDTDAIKVTKGILKTVEMISDPISVIEKVVTIHIKLSDTASLINTSFSVQLLFRITIAFITIVTALYTIGVKFSSTEEDTGILEDVDAMFTVWAASSALELVLIVWVTNSTCEEANKCPRLMHKIRNATKNAKLQDTIEMYSLQMYHNRLQFYVCGLFPLDYTFLHTIVAGVTTYLVILIQFNSANSASKKAKKHLPKNDTR
ncbi:hypothetical protein RI129_004493 [Pyrocoelia pectoralis]|uniref:Gustatory receptor n=1 Tax=Pyrocoelia pectoralis TaxID=417401 RepID=A0AAN7VGT8_9COLE